MGVGGEHRGHGRSDRRPADEWTLDTFADDIAQLKAEFLLCKSMFDELNKQGLQLDTLSMGMSSDLELAIECGSTCVRVGSALFGARA